MSNDISKQDAIAILKKAIIRCHLNDLPRTKASMSRLLETINVTGEEHFSDDEPRRWLH